MKTIGMIGGMSWESSLEYYRIVNEEVHERMGGVHSAKCLLLSVDFAEIEEQQRLGQWEEATRAMINAAQALERGGADFIVICTNTMHKMADDTACAVQIPLLHIADAAADEILAHGITKIGLLGTRFTMEEPFYKERLEKKHNLQVVIPDTADRAVVHRIIYEELVVGKILPQSRAAYLRIIAGLQSQGCQGILLACTEIGMLVKQENCLLPLFDTTLLHARAAVKFALAG